MADRKQHEPDAWIRKPGNDMRGNLRGLKKRSEYRRKIMVGHRATSFKDADLWDIEFWQSRNPEERLSALVAIRNDVLAIPGKDKSFNWDY